MKNIKRCFWVSGWVLAAIACNKVTPVIVGTVDITPPGAASKTTLTANIQVEGEGRIKVKWFNAVYDTVTLALTDEIEVDSEGTYLSVLESELGWYWIDILDENDSLLWHTDSVFCGPDSSLPEVIFDVDHDSGNNPLTVTFTNDTKKDDYTRHLWEFGDGDTSTVWEPVHVYEDAGVYVATLKVYNLAGFSSDSVSIYVSQPVTVKSVGITPPGAITQTILTAHIQTEGKGEIKVRWFNAVYDTISLALTDEIEVDSEGTYLSVLESELGWYWIDILNEDDSLLWHTDSVFCGPDSSLPEVEFYPSWEYGPHPLTVDFYNETEKDEYTRAFWDFADGGTSTEWEPTYTFENAGQFYVILKVSNLAGSSQDSTLIFVW